MTLCVVFQLLRVSGIQAPAGMSRKSPVAPHTNDAARGTAPHHGSLTEEFPRLDSGVFYTFLFIEQVFDCVGPSLSTKVAETDGTVCVNEIDLRPCGNIPRRGNRFVEGPTLVDVPPWELFCCDSILCSFRVGITVDPYHCEMPILMLFHERPLVRVHAPAGPSPIAPEVQHHGFASIVRQTERHSIHVQGFNLRGYGSDSQMLQFENVTPRDIRQGGSKMEPGIGVGFMTVNVMKLSQAINRSFPLVRSQAASVLLFHHVLGQVGILAIGRHGGIVCPLQNSLRIFICLLAECRRKDAVIFQYAAYSGIVGMALNQPFYGLRPNLDALFLVKIFSELQLQHQSFKTDRLILLIG